MRDDIIERDKLVYQAISKNIVDIEERIEGKIIFGRCAGSRVQGLNSVVASDEDFHIFVEGAQEFKRQEAAKYGLKTIGGGNINPYKIELDNGTVADLDIDIIFLEEIEKELQESTIKDYPTNLYRTKQEDEEISQVYKSKALRLQRDYGEWVLQLLILNDTIWLADQYSLSRLNSIYEAFKTIDILDAFFVRAYGNYHHFMEGNQKVLVRKYLYTLYQLGAIRWIIEKRVKPPMNFERLLEGMGLEEELFTHIMKMKKSNHDSTIYKGHYLERADELINQYIKETLEYAEIVIREYDRNETFIKIVRNTPKENRSILCSTEGEEVDGQLF